MSSSDSGESDEYSDITDVDANFVPYQLPTTGPSMYDMRQALEHTQKQLQRSRDANKRLRLQNADIKSQLTLFKTTKGKRANRKDVLLSSSEMTRLGKSFTILVAPWIMAKVFDKFPPSDAPSAHSKARFLGDPEDYWKTLNIELHAHLEEKDLCEKAVYYEPFRVEFVTQVRQERSAAIRVARESASLIFHDLSIDPQMWLTKSDARKDSAALKSLLHFPGQTPDKSAFSPIFYPSLKKVDHLLFMNDYLPKVLRAILFGKQSLLSETASFSPQVVGMLWNVKETNSSCIAFCAIAVQFLLSSDTEFSRVGSKSGINYQQNFFQFKRVLAITEKTEYSRMLYQWWNSRVFKGVTDQKSSSTISATPPQDAFIDEITEAMANILRLDGSDTATSALAESSGVNSPVCAGASPTTTNVQAPVLAQRRQRKEHNVSIEPEIAQEPTRGRTRREKGNSSEASERKADRPARKVSKRPNAKRT
ncbi:hypothetical protein VKT23_011581 [Stygiomarasmius scandens]|uniref:Uncharacterized protein n=1 Tax=Marasmiellus scandens TaxID=2682957 RepID=A0ABR1JB88_9AGAR